VSVSCSEVRNFRHVSLVKFQLEFTRAGWHVKNIEYTRGEIACRFTSLKGESYSRS
jgi:hypothetical protein